MKTDKTGTAVCYLLSLACVENVPVPDRNFSGPFNVSIEQPTADTISRHTSRLEPIFDRRILNPKFIVEPIVLKDGFVPNNSRAIDQCADLPFNWDSFGGGPISPLAIKNAKEALQLLEVSPDRVSPTPDDSILFEIRTEGVSTLMEFFGSGEITVVRNDGQGDTLDDFTDVQSACEFISEAALVNS